MRMDHRILIGRNSVARRIKESKKSPELHVQKAGGEDRAVGPPAPGHVGRRRVVGDLGPDGAVEPLQTLGVSVLDHLVIGDGYWSFKEHGFIET